MLRRKWNLMEEIKAEGQELPGPAEPQGDDDSAKWADFLFQDEGEEPADLVDEEAPPQEAEPSPDSSEEKPEETPAVQPGQEQQPAPVVPAHLPPEELAKYREQFQIALEKSYAFSEDDAAALQIEPEKVLPKMAAKLHMEVLDEVMQHLYQAMPQVIQTYTAASAREEKARGEFFSAWPELQGYQDQVLQMGQMYRQMNPAATPQEAIQRIGEMTMAALGLRREKQEPSGPAPAPFRPAAPGRVGSPPPAKSKWEAIFDDD